MNRLLTFIVAGIGFLMVNLPLSIAQVTPKKVQLEGIIEKRIVNRGSHSEAKALVLIQSNNQRAVRLRAPHANPFVISPELEKLLGLHVECIGYLLTNSSTLIEAECEPSEN